jgi:phospholipid/cholesterol/gamma-HCH transport system permease protein
MTTAAAWLRPVREGETLVLLAGGRWLVAEAARIDALLKQSAPTAGRPVRLDLAGVEALDTAGAWLFHRTMRDARAAGCAVEMQGARAEFAALIDQAAANDNPCEIEPPVGNVISRLVERIGAASVDLGREALGFLGFFGLVLQTLLHTLIRPRRLRFTPMVYHMEQAGLNALPIVGLLSFLIGVVLAYQGADQLRRFGADVFVVNLIAVSTLREIGILITAIIIAGRSGSAFTAQIGSMKVNEEIDAMRTLGLNPLEMLVVPRMLALIITLPLLGFYADMMGLLGGGLMSWVVLDISPVMFIERLNDAVSVQSFWVGLIKAPFFALLIAMVGCYEGFQVTGSAESVGQLTTRSVVESLFLVIITDAAFSIFFSAVGM